MRGHTSRVCISAVCMYACECVSLLPHGCVSAAPRPEERGVLGGSQSAAGLAVGFGCRALAAASRRAVWPVGLRWRCETERAGRAVGPSGMRRLLFACLKFHTLGGHADTSPLGFPEKHSWNISPTARLIRTTSVAWSAFQRGGGSLPPYSGHRNNIGPAPLSLQRVSS